MLHEEYLDVIIVRLESLAFVSGESVLKFECLYRLCSILNSRSLLRDVERVLNVLRVYTLDWDRSVRASAFRALRYIFSADNEQFMVLLSIEMFSMIRLESSKSSMERAEILRLFATWVTIGKNVPCRMYIIKSLSEMVVGQVSQGVSKPTQVTSIISAFTETLIDMVIALLYVYPDISHEPLAIILQGCFSMMSSSVQHRLIDALLFVVGTTRRTIEVPQTCLTPAVVEQLLSTSLGTHILSISPFDFDRVLNSEGLSYIDVLLEVFRTVPAFGNIQDYQRFTHSLDLCRYLLRFIREQIMKRTPVNAKYVELLLLSSSMDEIESISQTCQWRYPDWVTSQLRDLLGMSRNSGTLSEVHNDHSTGFLSRYSLMSDLSPFKSPIPDQIHLCDLSESELEILDLVSGLASGVQFKAKCASLSARKQKSPELFQSVSLFFGTQKIIRASARFPLQARRLVHGLFVHTLCETSCLELFDKLGEKVSSLVAVF